MGCLEDIMDRVRFKASPQSSHTCPQVLLSYKITLYPQVMECPRSENLPSTAAIGISERNHVLSRRSQGKTRRAEAIRRTTPGSHRLQ